jgi:hypothetical protein
MQPRNTLRLVALTLTTFTTPSYAIFPMETRIPNGRECGAFAAAARQVNGGRVPGCGNLHRPARSAAIGTPARPPTNKADKSC